MMAATIVPDIIASISFRTTEEGGRNGPTPSNFLACTILVAGQFFDCRLLLDGVGSLHPGQQARVPIALLDPVNAKPYFKVGCRIELRELRVIGSGVVEQVLDGTQVMQGPESPIA